MPKPEDLERRRLESHKLVFELFKHLTTLATGAVLIVVAFLERAFRDPAHRGLAVAAAACLLVSTVCSLLMMFSNASSVRAEDVPESGTGCGAAINAALVGSPIFFVLGLLLLALFAFLNL